MIGFNGGLIGKDRNTGLLAAVGVWTPAEQIKAVRNTLWPVTGLAFRYFRWTFIALRSGAQGQVSEFNIRNGSTNISMTSATMTTTLTGTLGIPITNMIDGSTATKMYFQNDVLPQSVTINMGSIVPCTGYRWFTADDSPERDPVSWTLEGSTDNTTYVLLDTKTNFAVSSTRFAEVGPFTFS